MVKKLIKHEWIALLRKMIQIWAVVLGVSVITRLVYLVADDSVGADILCGSSAVLYVLALLVCLVLTAVNLIVRFYKNMFTAEGYLTLTLPATQTQHLLAKGISAFSIVLCSTVVCILSVGVVTFGDLAVEIFKAADYLLRGIQTTLGSDLTLFVIEGILFLIFYAIMEIYFFYMIMSLGQLAKKNRVAASVGIYFLFYFGFQFLATIFTIIFSTTPFVTIGIFDGPEEISPIPIVHTVAVVLIAGCCVLTVVWFLISRHVLTKKLNLE